MKIGLHTELKIDSVIGGAEEVAYGHVVGFRTKVHILITKCQGISPIPGRVDSYPISNFDPLTRTAELESPQVTERGIRVTFEKL
jgi:hypothetical protein